MTIETDLALAAIGQALKAHEGRIGALETEVRNLTQRLADNEKDVRQVAGDVRRVRDISICDGRARGESLKDLSARHNLTAGRISQIVSAGGNRQEASS